MAITSKQAGEIEIAGEWRVPNFCTNDYLGLADVDELAVTAQDTLDGDGFGMASVRFIFGTTRRHKPLEERISDFLGTEDTIPYPSCFEASSGLFETILGLEAAAISDTLNHDSIVNGIRPSRSRRSSDANNDRTDFEAKLKEAQDVRCRLVATDGAFSIDGVIAKFSGIYDLAERYDAMVMVDDRHATGFLGKNRRGSPEFFGFERWIDILIETLGKVLGGPSGGLTAGEREVVDWPCQRSRPYFFPDTLPPGIAATPLEVLDLVEAGGDLRSRRCANSETFRTEMTALGFIFRRSGHSILHFMLGVAALAAEMAALILDRGVT